MLDNADLEHVRSQLNAWRTAKKGRPSIPEPIFRAVVALLDRYPLDVVCRELRLKAGIVRKRLANSSRTPPAVTPFFDITPAWQAAAPLASPQQPLPLVPPLAPVYRLDIERADGVRLSLRLPACDPECLQALVLAFARQ